MRSTTSRAPSPLPVPGIRIVARVLAAALLAVPLVSPSLEAQRTSSRAEAPRPSRAEAQRSPSRTVVTQAHGAIAPAIDSSIRESIRDSTELQAVGRRYARTVLHCYQEQGLKGDPALRGLLLVELVVLPTGLVQTAAATATDVIGDGMPAVATCVSTVARSWRFSERAPFSERVVLEFDLLPPSP